MGSSALTVREMITTIYVFRSKKRAHPSISLPVDTHVDIPHQRKLPSVSSPCHCRCRCCFRLHGGPTLHCSLWLLVPLSISLALLRTDKPREHRGAWHVVRFFLSLSHESPWLCLHEPGPVPDSVFVLFWCFLSFFGVFFSLNVLVLYS